MGSLEENGVVSEGGKKSTEPWVLQRVFYSTFSKFEKVIDSKLPTLKRIYMWVSSKEGDIYLTDLSFTSSGYQSRCFLIKNLPTPQPGETGREFVSPIIYDGFPKTSQAGGCLGFLNPSTVCWSPNPQKQWGGATNQKVLHHLEENNSTLCEVVVPGSDFTHSTTDLCSSKNSHRALTFGIQNSRCLPF